MSILVQSPTHRGHPLSPSSCKGARRFPKKPSVLLKAFQLRPTPGFGGEASAATKRLIQLIDGHQIGPVLSLRSSLPEGRGCDLHALLSSLDGYEHLHFLSFGCNTALANSQSLASLLVRVLRKGFIWACDFGELYFKEEVFENLLNELDPATSKGGKIGKVKGHKKRQIPEPTSNLAFSFADMGCGLKAAQISRLKDLTRRRRLLDKSLSFEKVDRTHAPWLDIPRVFGLVMRSKSLTKCFWRPYQEAEFWRRAGFHCTGCAGRVHRSGGKRVNPSIRRLTTAMHRGNLEPAALQKAFPPGKEGEHRSNELLQHCLKRDLPPAPLPRWVLPEHGGSPARAGGAPERQPVLRQGLLKRRKTENSFLEVNVFARAAQQRWRDTAVLEEVSEAQRQMGHWRNEAERSGAEVTKLRVKLEELQRQSLEQAKVEEAKRNLMQQALKEQGQEMQLEFDRALREVQDLRDKQEYELEDKIRQLEENDLAVDAEGKLERLQDELSKSAELLHNSEVVAQKWQNEAQEHKEKLNEEVLELHQSYAKRLQSLRAQHGGERRAFEAAEEELRQIYTKELQISRRHQEAWSEATEAALAGEARESFRAQQARLARKVQEESESAVMRQEMEVQQKLQAQLLLLKSHLGGPEAPAGLHPTSYELFKDLCWSIEAALCEEVRQNPCSELRRSLCRDLKQELRDQLRSEIRSAQRSREASTGSTTGSSARRFQAQESPPSAIRQELSRRGAALMEAFAAAAETKG
eukprot:symbB.v1.2.006872.t1/scaffold382.1/size215954/6